MRFAYQEIKLCLAHLLTRYRFTTTPETPEELTFKPASALLIAEEFPIQVSRRWKIGQSLISVNTLSTNNLQHKPKFYLKSRFSSSKHAFLFVKKIKNGFTFWARHIEALSRQLCLDL